MFCGEYHCGIDANGRICLPAPLRKELGGVVKLVVAGCGDYIEVWPEGAWAKEKPKMEKTKVEVK